MKSLTFSTVLAAAIFASGLHAAPTEAVAVAETSPNLMARSIGVYRPISSSSNTALCLEQTGGSVVLATCTGARSQLWGPFHDGGNIYRFQNHNTADCMWITDNPVSGRALVVGGCTLSNGSGDTVSNTEWDIGTQMPPSTTTTMKTRVHFRDNNLCLNNDNGVTVTVRTCVSNAQNQRWILGSN